MPSDEKGNAREMLAQTLKLFQQMTEESISVIYSWEGGLSVLGNSSFKNYVSKNRLKIWNALTSRDQGEIR